VDVVCALSFSLVAAGQKYPEPEFSNEIYYFDRDSSTLARLEKGNSKLDTKIKMAGFGGAESGYEIEGDKSTVRLNKGKGLSFVFFNGSSQTSNAAKDSMMKANGIDPAMLREMTEPSSMITLYLAKSEKDKRKVFLQKSGGANPFASHKNQSSDKYTFSIKKIREGYWELVIDKTLPKGEYIFTMMNMGFGNMDGSTLLFAFAID
jgi:hypothetical protein